MKTDFISAKEASKKACITKNWVLNLCRKGKIEGAFRSNYNGQWLVPEDWAMQFELSKKLKKINPKILTFQTQKIHLYETSAGYVSPYSLFMIDNYPLNFCSSAKFCDYGAGTGILGIVASLYGVSNITSIENNDECFALMKENYKYNTSSKIDVFFCKTEDECTSEFDVIVCNPASLPNFIEANSFCDGGVYGVDMILQVLDFSAKNLTQNGKLYIIITSILPLSIVKEKMSCLGLKHRIIAKRIIPFRAHYKGIAEWVEKNQNIFPEMYFINEDDVLKEELLLFEIEKE